MGRPVHRDPRAEVNQTETGLEQPMGLTPPHRPRSPPLPSPPKLVMTSTVRLFTQHQPGDYKSLKNRQKIASGLLRTGRPVARELMAKGNRSGRSTVLSNPWEKNLMCSLHPSPINKNSKPKIGLLDATFWTQMEINSLMKRFGLTFEMGQHRPDTLWPPELCRGLKVRGNRSLILRLELRGGTSELRVSSPRGPVAKLGDWARVYLEKATEHFKQSIWADSLFHNSHIKFEHGWSVMWRRGSSEHSF